MIVCDPPYIRHASDCCLDKNNNAICDTDEQTSQKSGTEQKATETPSGIEPPVQETPAQPTHPETPEPKDEVFQEKCTLPSGIGCIDFQVTPTGVTLVLRNGLGFDINTMTIAVPGCTGAGTLDQVGDATTDCATDLDCDLVAGCALSNGDQCKYSKLCTLTGSKFDSDVTITYTNADSGLSHTSVGTIVSRVE